MPIKRHDYILLIIAAVLIIAAMYQRLSIKKYTVQNFTGSSSKEVEKWMDTESVPEKNVVFNRIYSETVPEGTVIYQSIDANRTVSGNNSLVVTVSKGSDPNFRITLTDFSDMNQDEITEWFEKNRIRNYQFIQAIDDNRPEGTFLSVDPSQGTRITRDEPVTVTMSMHDNSPTVAFPDFTGQTVDDIQTWADQNDITVNFVYYYDTSAYGTFLFSDVPVGIEIEKGSYLSVAVSSGSGA